MRSSGNGAYNSSALNFTICYSPTQAPWGDISGQQHVLFLCPSSENLFPMSNLPIPTAFRKYLPSWSTGGLQRQAAVLQQLQFGAQGGSNAI